MMRRLAFFILVASSSFGVGVILTRSIRFLNKPSSAVIAPVGQIPSSFQNNRRQYHRGPAGLATRGSFITLNSSDGMNFTKWTVYCQSSNAAAKRLQKGIRGAVNIFSREPVYDDKGQQIGEKIVALFSANDARNAPASLLWTENEEFFQVEGSSLHDILEYRKDFNR